jgi:anti-sigma factor ChrR (cupin superfamily)
MRTRPLWEDKATGRKAHIVEFEPGAGMPLHRHIGHELIYMIEGSLVDESGTLRPGNVAYRPNGCVHSNMSPNGAIALAIIDGPSEPATEIGDAPPSQIFVPEDHPWEDAPGGRRTRRAFANESAGWTIGITRFPAGAGIPLHRHVGDELIFVIEGASVDESGPITPGNMSYRPNGTEHTVKTETGATALAIVWGRTEPI